jgi:hypothetical protein
MLRRPTVDTNDPIAIPVTPRTTAVATFDDIGQSVANGSTTIAMKNSATIQRKNANGRPRRPRPPHESTQRR